MKERIHVEREEELTAVFLERGKTEGPDGEGKERRKKFISKIFGENDFEKCTHGGGANSKFLKDGNGASTARFKVEKISKN